MFGIQPFDIAIHAANVLVTFILLRVILWKRVVAALNLRRERVQKDLDDAAAAKADAEKAKSQIDAELSQIDDKKRELLRQAQQKADEEAAAIIQDARVTAERALADAHQKIDDERRRAIASARADISALAGQLASGILRREVRETDDKQAVKNFFANTDAPNGVDSDA